MKPPWIAYVSVYGYLLIFLAGCAVPRRLDPAKIWIMFWAITYFIGNLCARYLAVHHLYNSVMSYMMLPIHAVQILLAFSYWQRSPVARRTVRLSIPVLVIAIIALTFTVEEINLPSVYAEPLYSLVMLGVATFTLVTLSAQEEDSVLARPWFWICVGLILHFGALAVLTPIMKVTAQHDLPLYIRVVLLRAWINVGAELLITFGMLCPLTTSSGPSS